MACSGEGESLDHRCKRQRGDCVVPFCVEAGDLQCLGWCVVSRYEKSVEDVTDRALLYLRLYGCHNGSCNHSSGLDDLIVERLLPGFDQAALSKAARKALEDPHAANGLARWIFWEEKTKTIDQETLQELLPRLARPGLTHPRQYNRRLTMTALGSMKTPPAMQLLRDCLAGKFTPAALPEEDLVEPGGVVTIRSAQPEVDQRCSDAVYAAVVLSQAGDRESLNAIRRLADKAIASDKKTYDEAIKRLDKGMKQ